MRHPVAGSRGRDGKWHRAEEGEEEAEVAASRGERRKERWEGEVAASSGERRKERWQPDGERIKAKWQLVEEAEVVGSGGSRGGS